MILVKMLKFFHRLRLSTIDREKLFLDNLDKKEVFKDYKNSGVQKTKN